jgi:hypothetical protein
MFMSIRTSAVSEIAKSHSDAMTNKLARFVVFFFIVWLPPVGRGGQEDKRSRQRKGCVPRGGLGDE